MTPAATAWLAPGAILGLGEALAAHGARAAAREIFLAAGHPEWLTRPPRVAQPEAAVAALHAALHRVLPPDEARAYAREAGIRTGDALLAHRMPQPARMVLRMMPPPIAARLLLETIDQQGWAFAGSGRFGYETGRPAIATTAANPLARGPGCDWQTALLRRLFQSLVDPLAEVQETACCARGAPACRFEISWPPPRGS